MSSTLDMTALGRALTLGLDARGLSANGLADSLGVSAAEVEAIEAGNDAHIGAAFRVIAWLEADITDFVVPSDAPAAEDDGERAARVAAYLRSHRSLKPESAEAIENVLQAAYKRFTVA